MPTHGLTTQGVKKVGTTTQDVKGKDVTTQDITTNKRHKTTLLEKRVTPHRVTQQSI